MKDCRNVGVLSTSEVTQLLKEEASSMAPSITLRKGAIFRSLFCHEVAASAPLLMTKAAAATALGGVERAEFIVSKAVLRWRS